MDSKILLLTACCGLIAFGVTAQERYPFDGDEFLINTTTAGDQTVPGGVDLANFTADDPAGPAIDADDAGNFVVVWTDELDGDGNGIFARGFNADGSQRFAEIPVNVGTTGVQENPVVAVDADGDFVVVWESDPSATGDLEIFARGFDASGNERFVEAKVNTITALNQEHPRIDMRPTGDYIIVWDSGDDETAGNKEAHFRRFNANGSAMDGSDRTANVWSRGNQRFPDVAFDGTGNFVVTWQSGAGGTGIFQDGDLSGIYARLFDSSGTAIDVSNGPGQCFDACAGAVPACTGDELIIDTKEICVNDYAVLSQDLPRVARNDVGDFVITWHSDGSNGAAPPGAARDTDSSRFSVHAKRFEADGDPKAPAWQVNTFTLSEQVFPDVSIAAGGPFVITWASMFQEVPAANQVNCDNLNPTTVLTGGCDRLSEVYAEEYLGDGTVRTAEFIVNTGSVNPGGMSPLDGIQVYPAVDVAATGSTVMAWSSGPPPSPFPGASTDEQDGDGFGALGRLAGPLDAGIFIDGFESGNTSAWSQTIQ